MEELLHLAGTAEFSFFHIDVNVVYAQNPPLELIIPVHNSRQTVGVFVQNQYQPRSHLRPNLKKRKQAQVH